MRKITFYSKSSQNLQDIINGLNPIKKYISYQIKSNFVVVHVKQKSPKLNATITELCKLSADWRVL